MQKNCSVVILAAGYSRRMGQLKFALTLNDGITFIERIVKQYLRFGCEEIVVVLNKEGRNYLRNLKLEKQNDFIIALNKYPERERFYSLKNGLLKLKNPKHVFIQNVDNPFINYKVLDAIYVNRANADYVKPMFMAKGGHPILISNKIVNDIVLQKDYTIHLNKFLKSYLHKEVEVGDRNILININTIDEYLKY